MLNSFPAFFFFLATTLSGAPQFSLSSDISLLRNYSPQQKFWAADQSIKANWYSSAKGGPYVAATYYLQGKLDNNFTAISSAPVLTPPETKDYSVRSSWQLQQLSLG